MMHVRAADESGQMTVEMAALIPVIVVVALIVFNLAGFIGACASFDRVATDAVVAYGVSPAGEQSTVSATAQIQGTIEEALASSRCQVEVSCSAAEPASGSEGLSFPISPFFTTYRVVLRYKTWPGPLAIAGVAFTPPLELVHERSFTVDRFRSGVVI